MTNRYEVTVAISLSVAPDSRTKIIESVDKLITDLKGQIISSDNWGEKPLAYRIKKEESALFQHYQIELPAKNINQLQKKLLLTEGIIRTLVVISD